MAAFEGDDATSFRRSRPGLLAAARHKPPMPPRFAFVKTPAWADADPDMRTAFTAFVARLGERAAEIDIPVLGDVIEWQRIVQLAENAHYYGPLMQQAPELISPGLTQRLNTGLAIDAQDYLRAITGREPAYRSIAAALRRLQRHPDAGGARPGAGRSHGHRQPHHQRVVDLPRHADGVAAAADGSRLCPSACSSSACATTTGACCARRAGWPMKRPGITVTARVARAPTGTA